MSTELEERLSAHLHNRTDDVSPGADELRSIKSRARQRSWRTRVAAGLGGLALVAGAASLVPVSDDANSLVNAAEPAPDDQSAGDPTSSPAANQDDPPPPVEPVPGTPVKAPPGFDVIADGVGGFVAYGAQTDASLVNFVRSSDGEEWFAANSWKLPAGMRAGQLRFANGLFIIVLDTVDPAVEQDGFRLDPQLAVSRDLRTWDIIDLDRYDESDPDTPASDHHIGDIAVDRDDIALVVVTVPRVDLEKYGLFQRDICGVVEASGQRSAVLCDGGLLPLEPGDTVWPTQYEQQVLVSTNGEPATAYQGSEPVLYQQWGPTPSIFLLAELDDEFTVIHPGQSASGLLPDALLGELGSDAVTVEAAETASDGTSLVVARVGTSWVPVVLSDDGAARGQFPGEAATFSGDGNVTSIVSGPAGWTVAIIDHTLNALTFERNGWQFTGYVGSPSAFLTATDGSESVWFGSESAQLPPGVNVGIFGGVRYLHPQTGELLAELTREEQGFPAELLDAAPPSAFIHTLTVDGWTFGGDPLRGPLTLTSPAGVVTEFSDGFAFDNDDITDGVETDIGSQGLQDFALNHAGAIRFYDDAGNELVSIRGRQLLQALVEPVLGNKNTNGTYSLNYPEHLESVNSRVLFSADGITWDVIWSNLDGRAPTIGNVVVGDDEVLLSLPLDITRIPLDD